MIIPALDLAGGSIVRLRQGDFNQKTVFALNPITRIRQARNAGATLVHIVDLDGAKNPHHRQLARISALIKADILPIQTGGGVRSLSDVAQLLRSGAARVVIGSAAVKHPELVRGWIKKFGAERITLALDVRIKDGIPYTATHGWLATSDLSIDAVLKRFSGFGLKHVLVTDISRDGMMQGANNDLYAKLSRRWPKLDIIASGGISCLDDIKRVAQAGASSVVLGRALLEGKFTVREAFKCWQNA